MAPWIVLRLLTWAATRWPAEMRADLIREWQAELHALGEEDGATAAVRLWRQIRFAASLTTARPQRTAGARSPLLGQVVWSLAAPAPAVLAGTAACSGLAVIPLFSKASIAGFTVIGFALQAAFAAWGGTMLGRRFLRHVGIPSGIAWTVLPLIGGLLLVDGLARFAGRTWAGSWLTVLAALCLSFVLPPVAAGLAAVARRRPRVAVGLGAVAAPCVSVSTVYAVTLAAPRDGWLAYIGEHPLLTLSYSTLDSDRPIDALLSIVPSLVLVTVVVAIAQAIRLARPLAAAVVQPVPADWIPAAARSPWWHRIALTAGAYCVLAWAVTLTYLTPNIGVQNSWPSRNGPNGELLPSIPAGWPQWSTEEGRLWMQELQLSCIVCAALCLLFAAAYRGRPLLPALAGSAVLLAANMVVVREGWITLRLLPWLAGGALIIGALAWSVATHTRPRHPVPSRRLLITVTVLAAFLVPGGFMARVYITTEVQAPPILLAVAVGLPAILTMLAAMGVRAVRPGVGWRWPAGLALLTAVVGVLYYELPVIGGDIVPIFLLIGPPALAAPAAVWTISAVAARPPTRRGFASRVGVTLLLLAGGWPIALATVVLSMIIAGLVLFPMEYGATYDGLVYVPGAVAIGVFIGYITALRLTRPSPTPIAAAVADLGHPPPEAV